jgi:CRP-like cAMP-binding protein
MAWPQAGRVAPSRPKGTPNNKASATVTAVEFSQVWGITRDSMEDFINQYPTPAAHLLVGIGGTLAQRLRDVNTKVARFFSA